MLVAIVIVNKAIFVGWSQKVRLTPHTGAGWRWWCSRVDGVAAAIIILLPRQPGRSNQIKALHTEHDATMMRWRQGRNYISSVVKSFSLTTQSASARVCKPKWGIILPPHSARIGLCLHHAAIVVPGCGWLVFCRGSFKLLPSARAGSIEVFARFIRFYGK